MRGVSDFMQEHDRWSVFQPTEILGRFDPNAISTWSGDGIIARIANRAINDVVQSKGIPAIDVLGNIADSTFPKITCDEEKVARMAMEHLASINFRHFAYFGLNDENWSKQRGDSFRDEVSRHNQTIHRLDTSRLERNSLPVNEYISTIAKWLERLPKPIGIFICSDQLGPDLLEACSVAEIAIPSQAAIISVDNDAPFCEICRPKLSSISANHRIIGYQAARMLDKMLDGKEPPERSVVAPRKIVSRQSTDIIATEDEAIRKAQQAIWEEATHGITVNEVSKRAGVSRSVLQRRFKNELNTTINEELLKRKVLRAKELMQFTELDYNEIAERSGFTHQEYLSYIFKKRLNATPASYRKSCSK